MLSAIAIVPSAPVLVPEIAGPGTVAELADLRRAVLGAAAVLPSSWVVLGAGPADADYGPDAAGTFAGFGVDVPVRLSPGAEHETDLPLCALIAGWVRGRVNPDASAEIRVCGPAADADRGRRLRDEIDAIGDPVGVLVIGDGPNTLTPSAPGGYRPADVDVQHALAAALAAGDTAALTRLPVQIGGRTVFAVLAGLAGSGPRSVIELYRGAPYGVGYFAGVWQP